MEINRGLSPVVAVVVIPSCDGYLTLGEKHMADSLELFNSHQEDVRRRADSLAKAIFILAGGTLTVSIGLFTGSSAPQLTTELSCVLKASWWALIISIIFLVMTLTIIIARDYVIGERWRKQLAGHVVDVSGKPALVEAVILIFATLGILVFIFGLLGQAYVASNVIETLTQYSSGQCRGRT